MLSIIENTTGVETRNEEIRKELETIASRKAGLNPSTLLAVAKNPKSTLYQYFTWDDTEAARKYREFQAYELIRRVKVTIETHDSKEITIRAFWPVKQVEKDGTIDYGKRGNYLRIDDAFDDKEALKQIMENAKGELDSFSTKYSQLENILGFSEVFSAIKKIR
jgi:hypothetical protein